MTANDKQIPSIKWVSKNRGREGGRGEGLEALAVDKRNAIYYTNVIYYIFCNYTDHWW